MAGKTRKLKRPDWDSYFMQIAQVVALRSNCSRRQVAAVIVKDCRIISTGYNGTPRGIKNCCDGGCPRCASDAPSGTNLGECLCCHGEENAIVQAAYHGISVKDATLYTTFSPCLLCAKRSSTRESKRSFTRNVIPSTTLPNGFSRTPESNSVRLSKKKHRKAWEAIGLKMNSDEEIKALVAAEKAF